MEYKQYINGRFVEGQAENVDVICGATNKVVATIKRASVEQAEEALQAAQEAFKTWSFTSLNERTTLMNKIVEVAIQEKEEIIELLAQESGKSYGICRAEFDWFVGNMNFCAEEARRMVDIGEHEYDTHRDMLHRVMRRPLGVVVAHLAWNGSLLFVAAKLSSTMASGCTIVMKPSESTPLTALKIAEICHRVGVPAGVVNVLVGKSSVIGDYLTESKIPAMITLVGSKETGVRVAQKSASNIKKLSLELGGNAPYIIMPDADLEECAGFLVTYKSLNTGQACGAPNRIFVHDDIHDEFMKILVEKVKQQPIGWGPDVPDHLGAVIDVANRDRLLKTAEHAVEQGAKLVYGGKIPKNLPEELKDGAFMMQTILDDCTDDMDIANVELFGPVYPCYHFNDLDDVIARSNNTEYGLNSFLWTHDARTIVRIMEELDFGKTQINGAGTRSNNLPHIGLKQSGIGCMFGTYSLEQYYKLRLVALKP